MDADACTRMSWPAQAGTLRAELRIIKCSLSAILPTIAEDWQKDELRGLIKNIDAAIEETQ